MASATQDWIRKQFEMERHRVPLSIGDDGLVKAIGEDNVNSPKHYNQSGIECIDAIQAATDDGFQYYLQGNILKYIWRYRYKNGTEDLEKAQWYLNKLIEVRKTNG